MKEQQSVIFESATLGSLRLNNRLAVAPMTRVSALRDGQVGPLMKDYYERFAKGGFGLIITEGLYTDELYSQGYLGQPGIATKQQAHSWLPVIQAVHDQGAKIIAQLMHAGALSQFNRFVDSTAGPSTVRPLGLQMPFYRGDGEYPTPSEMTEKDIADVIDGFVQSAILAKSVGFDGVEIHGANGYLLDQFLTVYTNQRTDQYGGSLDNRLRIYQQIIAAVKKAVGHDFTVGVRFSQKKVNDNEYLWPEGEEGAKKAFSSVAHSGVDFIHTTEPVLDQPAFEGVSEEAHEGKLSLAALAKKYSGIPVIANGGVSDHSLASETIESNQADVIALGKTALANQDWPERVRAQEDLKTFTYEMFNPIADLETANKFFKSTFAE